MRSIRRYLLTRLVAGSAVALALAGLALFLALTRALESAFDRNLADRVRGLASILFQAGDEVEFEFSEQLMPEYARAERPAYFDVRYAASSPVGGGGRLEASPSLAGGELAAGIEPGFAPRCWSAPLPDGRPGRLVSQLVEVHHVYPEEGPDRPQAAIVQVVVARGTEELVAAERKVLLITAASFVGLILMIAVLARLAVEHGLEPARRLAASLERVQADRPPPHLDVGPLPEELAPVAAKTDLLLQRVGKALERERRTSADIAHELRTPISEVLTVSEVALRDGRDPAAGRRALATIREISSRMGQSVATLLELARLEMGARSPVREPVDLGALVAELLRANASAGRARDVRAEGGEIAPGETITGDPDVLRIVLSNLLANAFHHATPGSTVTCRLERTAARWRLAVENRTEELEPDDLRVLGQPFWRKDPARSDRRHSGLGLALSHALATRAGIALGFELEAGTFRALLRPSDPDAP